MNATTFRAQDMREALQKVKEKLGPDAVVLSTRSVREKGKGGLPTGPTMIEVTACASPTTEEGGGGSAAPPPKSESQPRRKASPSRPG
ncbi:MAG: hypothetical protein HQL53_14415, partial [Magnetococcales bacterium]|nr:hypothetical protein [Magnetococcales bacterium]